MADHRRQEALNNGDDDTSAVGSGGEASGSTASSGGVHGVGGLAERLNEILREEGGEGGDLLMQQSGRESNFLQWLQALDLQVMGACRADERLKPLLKISGSSADAAEDRLLAHLSQHFEAAEVGLLARCLCVPLVSMRVGKVIKQGSLLCPTSLRGTLNLTLLPASGLRLSFVGDNGETQRLATLSDGSECSTVTVQEILVDQSGRSFLVKPPGDETFYFWCSEKSKLLGIDLLSKMKDLLARRPTLAELTGISESRLESFAAHLRAYLVGPSVNNLQSSAAVSSASWTESNQAPMDPGQSLSTSARPMRARLNGGPAFRGHTHYQGTLSPRSSSFKDGLPKTLAFLRSTSREKLKHRGDLYLTSVDNSFVTETKNLSGKGKISDASISSSACPLSFLESLGKCSILPSPSGMSQLPPVSSSLFSPYYCWCPPCTSPSVAPIAEFPASLSESFSLPPLSALLSEPVNSSLLTPIPPLGLSCGSSLEFPALLSDPLARMPFPTQSSAPVPSFIPLMCDPIVHIPVLDVCSLGQGYLVSAGPAIATSIPQLHPKLVGPMMSESESILEKGARETLRLLIGSSSGQPSSLMGVLPAVLSNEDKKGVVTGVRGFYSGTTDVVTGSRGLYSGISDVVTGSRGLYSGVSDVVTGSRGLYSGISDVDVIVNSFAAVGLNTVSERSDIISSLMSCSTAASSDVPEQTSYGLDFQNSAFTPGENNKD